MKMTIKENILKALTAICEGYTGSITDGYIIVPNPSATKENMALGGVSPNLVIDVQELMTFLK